MKREDCTLCYGDGWISDSPADYKLCQDDEQLRFEERMGALGGAAQGRMACPRCQPHWKLPEPLVDGRHTGIACRIVGWLQRLAA